MTNITEQNLGKGCLPDPTDVRDRIYDEMALSSAPVDWLNGYDVEKEIGFKIAIKNQGVSESCVGQAWSYYVAILNAVEIGFYDEASAKAIYSQIFLSGGGAYLRDGADLIKHWGAVLDKIVPSYINGNPPTEAFMRDKAWLNDNITNLAKILKAKEYRRIEETSNMDKFAIAIRDNYGIVGGLQGENNGSWTTNEPKPPKNPQWGHAIYFGKFGIDRLGKYIATPNSWGTRGTPDELHPDGWQKLREDYFSSGYMFNPWTLTDQPNEYNMNTSNVKIIKDKNSPSVGIWLPALSDKALESYCLNFGLTIPKKVDGSYDWDKWIQGELQLK